MTYFLLIKGMKGASFVPAAAAAWVQENTWLLLLLSFAGWTMLMQVLLSVFWINILRLIVLFGTFSLAMAFAGNDLVNVIGGWFATALIAFTVSAIFALLIHRFQLWAIVGLVALAGFFIFHTFLIHKKKERDKAKLEAAQYATETLTAARVIGDTSTSVAGTLRSIRRAYRDSLEGLRREDLALLRQTKDAVKEIRQQNQEFKYTFYNDIRRIEESNGQGSRTYLLAYDLEQDIIQSIEYIVKACHKHIKNSHKPLSGKQDLALQEIQSDFLAYFDNIANALEKGDLDNQVELLAEKQDLHTRLEQLLLEQVQDVKRGAHSARNSLLYFNLLLETKDLVAVAARFAKLYYRLEHYSPEQPYSLVAGV